MGSMGPVSLNQMTIHAAMELAGVEFPEDCFRKVVTLGRYFVKKIREANDK